MSSGGVGEIVDEAIFTANTGSFEFTARVARIFMDGNKPISTYSVIPFVVVDGSKKYFESWSKKVDLEYVESLCPDNNHPHAIDLGLPSGTKWACCNVGASSPEEYGGYYAWGETSEKEYYDFSSYKWCNGSAHTMNKYCTDPGWGDVDDKKVLDWGNDAAYINWGRGWIMPFYVQQIELLENCTWTWTSMGGHKGYKVTSIINGNSIFLPAAGMRCGEDFGGDDSIGYYWSSMLYISFQDEAHRIVFDSSTIEVRQGRRIYGLSVRAVQVH